MKLHQLLKASVLTAISSLVIFVPQTIGNAHPDSTGLQIDKSTVAETITAPPFNNKALYSTIAVKPVEQAPVQAVSAPVSNNEAKAFIYQHESGNNPAAVNPGGCRGLGQACPGIKLPCGNDYACQDAWFTNYMQQRYGTWEKARSFWQAQCGSSKGCWW